MDLWGWLIRLLASGRGPVEPPAEKGMDSHELARRLGLDLRLLTELPIQYRRLTIPKRRGGTRVLHQPSEALARVQRAILKRLLRRLNAHPAATAFERGVSIVHNAMPHVGKDVVVRLDVRDFFRSTSAERVRLYFRRIGWNAEAAGILTRLCTHENALPQGAPTSPRLANLVNYGLDVRLDRFTKSFGGDYTRYADDITISFDENSPGLRMNPKTLERIVVPNGGLTPGDVLNRARFELEREGYVLNDKKLRVYRRHHRQIVAGLVVNDIVNLPRKTRRRLRAVQHHIETGRPATLRPEQLLGWRSLELMVLQQSEQAD